MQVIEPMALMNLKKGETALVLGNGPSMERVDFDRLSSTVVVMGMHRSWRQHNPPFHIILRQAMYWDEIEEGAWTPRGIVVTKTDQKLENWDLGSTRVAKIKSVSKRHPGRPGFMMPMHEGSGAIFCGQFALEVAAYMGFKRICLIGYDMQPGSGHAFPVEDEHISWDSTRKVQRDTMAATMERMKEVYPDTRVFNLAPDSALQCFPFADLEELYSNPGQPWSGQGDPESIELIPTIPRWDAIPDKIRIPATRPSKTPIPAPTPAQAKVLSRSRARALTRSRARTMMSGVVRQPKAPIALAYGSGSSRDPLRKPWSCDLVISEG